MIPRYTHTELAAVWEPENRYKIWLEIELAALEAWSALGAVPQDVPARVRAKARFDARRIDEIEKEVRHDVIAFLTNVAESVGPDSRHIHKGLTSSDVLDTCFALQLKRSSEIIARELDAVMAALKRRALEHKMTPQIGRTHGIHGEPVTFGLKLALFFEEMRRGKERLQSATEGIKVGKISGAMGTYNELDPRVEEFVCRKLGLKPDPISTQIVERDRHACFFTVLALIATSVERVALEIRHLQRTEVGEVEEFFSPGQKGSSAMPHKRNPVLSENLTGLARLMRGYALTAMENIPLWHERDISHSAAERVIGPDATVTLGFMLKRLAGVIEDLVVYPEAMRRNLDLGKGLYNSQRVMLALTEKGATREEAYAMVQSNAMRAREHGSAFLDELKADAELGRRLDIGELQALFDTAPYFRHVDFIFKRVFG